MTDTTPITPTVDELTFLLGRWEGTGTLRDRPFTSTMVVSEVFGYYLQVEVVCYDGDEVVHEERVLYYEDEARGLSAVSFSGNGAVMHWEVSRGLKPGRWTLRRAGFDLEPSRSFLWSIDRRADGSLHEEFVVARNSDDPETLVRLDYQRVGDAAE